MTRRRMLASVAAVALVIAAGAVAVGANVGLFGLAGDKTPVGHLTPVSRVDDQKASTTTAPLDPTVVTAYVDDPANPNAPGSPPAPSATTDHDADDHFDDHADVPDDDHTDDHADDHADDHTDDHTDDHDTKDTHHDDDDD